MSTTEPLKWRGEISAEDKAKIELIKARPESMTQNEKYLLGLLKAEVGRTEKLNWDLQNSDNLYNSASARVLSSHAHVEAIRRKLGHVQSLLSRDLKFDREPNSRLRRAHTAVTEIIEGF